MRARSPRACRSLVERAVNALRHGLLCARSVLWRSSLAMLLLAPVQAAAQERTRLMVYTSFDKAYLETLKQAAEAAVPSIEIVWVQDSPGMIAARIIAERPRPQADMIWGVSAFSLVALDVLDLLEPYSPTGAYGLRQAFRNPTQPVTWQGITGYAAVICFNPAVADSKGLPKPTLWRALVNPAYRGQIIMPNPASSTAGFVAVAGWISAMTEGRAWDFMQRLHSNVQSYSQQGTAPCDAAARGEVAIGISFDLHAAALKSKGAPIDIIVPTDGVGFDAEGVAVVRSTIRRASAIALFNFASSQAAMELYGRWYGLLGMPNVPVQVPDYPAEVPEFLVQQDFRSVALRRQTLLREWTDRFGRKLPIR